MSAVNDATLPVNEPLIEIGVPSGVLLASLAAVPRTTDAATQSESRSLEILQGTTVSGPNVSEPLALFGPAASPHQLQVVSSVPEEVALTTP